MVPELDVRLKMARAKVRLDQKQVAERIGVSAQTMSSYETGSYTPPPETLIKLADIYGVSVDYLLGVEKDRALFIDGLNFAQIDALEVVANQFKVQNAIIADNKK